MDSGEKLGLLAAAAKYDASCASSGSGRAGAAGSCLPAGVCHSWTGDGRCVSLLKILYSNVCLFDCAYCANRTSADIRRVSFLPSEIAAITMDFYRRNYIEGLFLSSGVFASPDEVMRKLVETARILRRDKGFGGYIHLKVIPGASERAVRAAGLYADRLSVNIELPSDKSLRSLAPDKDGKAILASMKGIGEAGREALEDAPRLARAPAFAPAGQSTQIIVGASPEPDRDILRLAGSLYGKLGLRRVYYSAYLPVSGGPRAPLVAKPPLAREHRLYQADWLLRFYRYRVDEIVDEAHPDLDPLLDPKCSWALRNPSFFPVDLAAADRDAILRVPGIGVTGTDRILAARRSGSLNLDNLRAIGVVMKRARYFISVRGRVLDGFDDPEALRALLEDGREGPGGGGQLELPFAP